MSPAFSPQITVVCLLSTPKSSARIFCLLNLSSCFIQNWNFEFLNIRILPLPLFFPLRPYETEKSLVFVFPLVFISSILFWTILASEQLGWQKEKETWKDLKCQKSWHDCLYFTQSHKRKKWGIWAAWSSESCPSPWQEGWTGWSLKVPSSPNHSVILWCCGSVIL